MGTTITAEPAEPAKKFLFSEDRRSENRRLFAQSLLLARQVVQGDKRRKWGVRSYDQESAADPLGYVDSVCRQVTEVERSLRRDMPALPRERVVEVPYEEFCADPVRIIERISEAVWGTPVDGSVARRELHLKARSTAARQVSPAEMERIERCLTEFA